MLIDFETSETFEVIGLPHLYLDLIKSPRVYIVSWWFVKIGFLFKKNNEINLHRDYIPKKKKKRFVLLKYGGHNVM